LDVPRFPAGYQIRHAESAELLSRHRTRSAAIDNWRERHGGIPVKIVRVYASGKEELVVEGIWHAVGPGELHA
jgi:hypothetical protein